MLTALLLLFVFMGSFAGYYAARMYKLFGGKAWKKNTVSDPLIYPLVNPLREGEKEGWRYLVSDPLDI